MSKVSGKRLAKLAARIVKLDASQATINEHGSVILFKGAGVVALRVSDITALAASVLAQAEPKENPKKARVKR